MQNYFEIFILFDKICVSWQSNKSSQGYGAGANMYSGQQGQPAQSVGYGQGYGAQQGFAPAYQGYENYQQPSDYPQSTVCWNWIKQVTSLKKQSSR